MVDDLSKMIQLDDHGSLTVCVHDMNSLFMQHQSPCMEGRNFSPMVADTCADEESKPEHNWSKHESRSDCSKIGNVNIDLLVLFNSKFFIKNIVVLFNELALNASRHMLKHARLSICVTPIHKCISL